MEENETVQQDNVDYTSYLQSILDNQEIEIELLEQQRDCMAEQINGLGIVINGQNAVIGILILFSVLLALWKIISKWFFGGV